MTMHDQDSAGNSIFQRFVAIFALTGFAVAQPLFDLFGKTPEFFVIRRTSGVEIVGLILILLFAVPLLVIAIEFLLGIFSKKLALLTHFLFTASITAAIILPVLVRLLGGWDKEGNWLIGIAFLAGIAVGLVQLNSKKFRSIFSYLAFGAVFFTFFFIYSLNTQGLLQKGELGVAIRTPDSKPAPVFMVIFDEFPLFSLLNEKREINSFRFPGFADLAKNSTWFRNGTTVSSWTERAVPVIMSGKYPDEKKKQLPSQQDYPQNIFTLLSGTHAIKGYEQVTHLCPDELCTNAASRDTLTERFQTLLEDASVVYAHLLLPEGKKRWLPNISFQWGGFLEEEKAATPVKKSKKGLLDKGEWSDDTWLFAQFINSIRNDVPVLTKEGKVPFYLIHITFPHVPYRYLNDGRKYLLDLERTNDVGYKKLWSKTDEWPATVALQRFILQAGYADSLVSDLLSAIRDAGVFDSSMIVVTADHGSSFQPGEFSRRVSAKNYMDVMPVPVFIKSPAQVPGTINERNIEKIDIVPTLLSEQKLQSPHPFDGTPAFDAVLPEREAKSFFPLEEKKPKKTLPKNLSFEPSLSKSIAVFGSGGFDDRFFNITPGLSEYIGNSVDTIQERVDTSILLTLEGAPDFSAVQPKSEYIPAFLAGVLTSKEGGASLKDGEARFVAVAVDGHVRAITKTEAAVKGRAKFGVIIPPSILTEGSHAVQALVLK